MSLKDDKNPVLSLPAPPDVLYPALPETSGMALAVPVGEYSASAIARAVEDCDAHLLNLNVSSERTPEGHTVVYLRVDRRNVESVSRSVERFGYTVIRTWGGGRECEGVVSARERVNQLLRILEI